MTTQDSRTVAFGGPEVDATQVDCRSVDDADGPGRERRARSARVLALGAGNALEWFDWGVYTAMLPFFSAYIFGGTTTGSVLKGLAVFAVGFIARPIGGLVFGLIADRRGRTLSLMLTIACVAGGCLGVAFLPSYATAGAFAGILLLVLRILQGLGQGGELPSLQVYIAENAPPARLGRWSSVIYTSGNVGVIAGMACGAAMASLLDREALNEWGWRIPFLVGGVLGLSAIALRRTLMRHERRADRTPLAVGALLRTVAQQWRALLVVAALVAGSTVAVYAWGNSAATFAITFGNLQARAALWIAVAAYATAAVLIPVWGALADRVGFVRVMLVGTGLVVVGSVPVSHLLDGSALNLYLCMIAMLVPINMVLAVEPVFIAQLIPPEARTTGIGITYSTVAAVLGGTAPYIRSWFHLHLSDTLFAAYVTVLAAISLVALVKVSRRTPR